MPALFRLIPMACLPSAETHAGGVWGTVQGEERTQSQGPYAGMHKADAHAAVLQDG